jgi:transcriptional regulator with XRE-family HTH domain
MSIETPAATLGTPTPASLVPRDPSPAELGRRIKLLRVSRGLTLKDLEERGGISATHVSEIERGKASPTVGALAKIARALGVRPAFLIEPRVLPQMTSSTAETRQVQRVSWANVSIEPLAAPIEGSNMGAYVMHLGVGDRESGLAHVHDGEEWVMALEGVVEIRVQDRVQVLREGDSLHFWGHRRHVYSNLGSAPAQLLVVCRPRLNL